MRYDAYLGEAAWDPWAYPLLQMESQAGEINELTEEIQRPDGYCRKAVVANWELAGHLTSADQD